LIIRGNMIKREKHLKEVFRYKDKHLIKVVTGVRRCGKSTLLEQYMEELKKQGVKEKNILFYNFEDFKFADLIDGKRYINTLEIQ